MTFLRKLVFYCLTILYFIICPVIILRMLGFILDPVSGQWVKTGIIYISSNPPDAPIYIDGQKAPEKTPTVIRDLKPGQYTLRIDLDGYEPWENAIPVVDKKASSVENILLLPKKWIIKPLSATPITQLTPMPGNNFLLVNASDMVKDLFILRLNKDIEERTEDETKRTDLDHIFPPESIYSNGRIVRYYTIEQSPFLILQISIGDKLKYLWVDPRDKQAHIEDISDLISDEPLKIYWQPNDERMIFTFHPLSVNRIDIKAKAIYPNITEKDMPVERKPKSPSIQYPSADQVFLVNNDNTLLYRKGQDIFLRDIETVGQPRLTKFLKVKDNTSVYFTEKTGRLFFIDAKTSLLSSVQILHHKPFIPKPIAETLRLNNREQE